MRDADNAATELVEDGVNGFVAASAGAGRPRRRDRARARGRRRSCAPSTADWFARNARELSLDASLDAVVAAYERV